MGGLKRLGVILAVLGMIIGAFAVVLFIEEETTQWFDTRSAGQAYVLGFAAFLLGVALIFAGLLGVLGLELVPYFPAIFRALRPLVSGAVRRAFVGAVGIVLVVTGGDLIGQPDFHDRLRWDYCSYGSVSEAQRQGCEERVDVSAIRRLDTSAARFARGELNDCLADSGPFCQTAVGARDAGY